MKSCEGCEPDEGVSNVVGICRIGTRFLMDTSYWQLLNDNRTRCATVVCLAMDLVLLLGLTVEPYVPLLAEKLQQLNVKATANGYKNIFSGIVPSGHELNEPQVLYQDIPDENIDEAKKSKETINVERNAERKGNYEKNVLKLIRKTRTWLGC